MNSSSFRVQLVLLIVVFELSATNRQLLAVDTKNEYGSTNRISTASAKGNIDSHRKLEWKYFSQSHDKKYHKQQQRQHRQRRLGGTKNQEDEKDDVDTARILVQYTDNDTRDKIIQLSKQVYHDFKRDMYLSIDVDEIALSQLATNENITTIEMDGIWIEQGIFEETVSAKDLDEYCLKYPQYFRQIYNASSNSMNVKEEVDNDNNSNSNNNHNTTENRNLQVHLGAFETIPYGISMTQADRVPYGRYGNPMVCIVDTGVLASHPDFDDYLLSGATRTSNKFGTLPWNVDIRGHGTHVAGIVSARGGNNYGVRGMGAIPTYITRGLSDQGQARESDIIEAMEQCEQAGSKVISLSLSGDTMSTPMKNVIDRLYDKNVMVVAAAGNEARNYEAYPASYRKVVSVGAVGENEQKWEYSNYGPWLELAAPGSMVLSLGLERGGEYLFAFFSGTSMATPHVASAAALLWSHYPECTTTQIRYALAYTAKDVGQTGCDDQYGYGIIQVKKAYDFLAAYNCRGSVWGQNIGDGLCSAIDTELANTIVFP